MRLYIATLGFLLAFLVPRAWASDIQPSFVSDTDDLISVLRQVVQNEYQIPAHSVLIIWGDDLLEDKLASFGESAQAQVNPRYLSNLVRRSSFRVDVFENGQKKGQLLLKAKVDAWLRVYRAKETLERNAVLSDYNTELVRLKASGLPPGPLRESKFIDDYMIQSTVQAGSVIKRSQLKQRPLVTKGDTIRIIVVNKGLRLVAQGLALDSGARGNMVRVKITNFGSSKEVKAKVIGTAEVKIEVK